MKKKLIILLIAVLLSGTLLTGLLSLSLIRNRYVDEVENRLLDNARLVEAILQEETIDSSGEVQKEVDRLGAFIDARITIINDEGVVLGDTFMTEDGLDNHLNREEIQISIEGDVGTSIRFSDSVQEEMLYVAIPAYNEDGSFFIIRLSLPLTEIENINRQLMIYIVISIALGISLASILGYRFINKIIEPVRELIDNTDEIAKGNLDKELDVPTEDEFSELAYSFNLMRINLKESFETLEDRNSKFQALLTSITNPIIAIDNEKRVILFNPAAENLFQTKKENVYGKHILEVIRNHVFDESVQKIFDENQETQIEWELHHPKKRNLKLNTSLIRMPNNPNRTIGMVVSIEDLTEMKKLERMRSDFVANVSHELKTPLTSIKGFVETLKAGAADDPAHRNRFLEIINIETDRLTRLIADILTLSEIENPMSSSLKGDVDVRSVIEETLDMIKPLAEDKNIRVRSEIEKEIPNIRGNQDWFKQMMINLLDNAVKYTPNSGEIWLRTYTKYGNTIISVKDNGLGIPKQDLPRLFERFYRVDKGRSRKVGGTGLGLAIVKHVVRSFDGRIKVHSEEGIGTEFVVILPKEEKSPR